MHDWESENLDPNIGSSWGLVSNIGTTRTDYLWGRPKRQNSTGKSNNEFTTRVYIQTTYCHGHGGTTGIRTLNKILTQGRASLQKAIETTCVCQKQVE